MTKQPTCAELISEHLVSRVESIRAIEARLDAYDGSGEDDPFAEASEWPLSIESHVTIDVTLSTGGPADGFRITFDTSESIPEAIRGEYWYQDWFDGATLPIDRGLIESVVNLFGLDQIIETQGDRSW